MPAFSGRTVLITGAASGIGLACALELARRGARLGLVDIDVDNLAAAAAATRALGAETHTFVVDLARPDAIATLARDAPAQLGAIDVLFSNAGVAVVKPLATTSDDDWRWIFDVNVWAPIRLVRALLPAMMARGRGHVVLTASLAGLVGAPGMVAYSTTKFALVGFAESLRHELGESGVAVTIVCPGHVKTNLHRATRYDNAGFQRLLDAPPWWYGLSSERAARRIVDGIAARRPLVVMGAEQLGWWLKRLWPAGGLAVTRFVARRHGVLAAETPCTSR